MWEGTVIKTIEDWPISHRVRGARTNFHCIIYTGYHEPFEKGFIWHPAGNDNYKGYLIDEETLHDDDQMYE